MAATTFHIRWYANGLRAERLQSALADVTPTAGRYGASAWALHRSRDDRYVFVQMVEFEDKAGFDRWWHGEEMTVYRTVTSGWWQVPVLYAPHDKIVEGRIETNGNGGSPAPAPEPAPAESTI
jgi:hypothetical protein